MMTEMEITKTGEDRYSLLAQGKFLHIEEDVNSLQMTGMLEFRLVGTTYDKLLTSFNNKPIGHKIRIVFS